MLSSRLRLAHRLPILLGWVILGPALAGAQAFAGQAKVDDQRLLKADSEAGQWLMVGRTYAEDRFSPLAQINTSNIKRLGLAWFFATGTRRGLEATPVVVDGVMYATGTWSRVYALDAATGKLIWSYDPQVPRRWGAYACCDVVNRGVAVWQGRVYVGTLDGRLVALEAATGKPLWSVMTVPAGQPYTITMAPRVIHGKVILGNGGAEYPGVRGYVSAYDGADGHLVWRFYTVPGASAPAEGAAMAQARRTWPDERWQMTGGGGTVWNDIAYDPQLNLVYFGTGNPSPWNSVIRNGDGKDNLFTDSIVALDADSGAYRWHFQTTPADAWDYDADENLVLATLKIDGRPRRVVMQANKNGFFYLLDRASGEFISGKAFVAQNWASRLDPATGRPVLAGPPYGINGRFVRPSVFGAHNWQPMAFDPGRRLAYIPAIDAPFLYQPESRFRAVAGRWSTGLNLAAQAAPAGLDPLLLEAVIRRVVGGELIAWDPVEQRARWRAKQPLPFNGGVLATSGGMVFQGTADGRFVVYDADRGAVLWQRRLPNGIIAAPMSYEIAGKQYVAVMMGFGGALGLSGGDAVLVRGRDYAGYLLVWTLDGAASLAPAKPARHNLPEPFSIRADSAALAEGDRLYNQHCAVCHGANVISASALPDLRYIDAETHRRFNAIVLGGGLSRRGMPGFADLLTAAQVEKIHAYVVKRAELTRHAKLEPRWWTAVKEFVYPKIAPLLNWLQMRKFG